MVSADAGRLKITARNKINKRIVITLMNGLKNQWDFGSSSSLSTIHVLQKAGQHIGATARLKWQIIAGSSTRNIATAKSPSLVSKISTAQASITALITLIATH